MSGYTGDRAVRPAEIEKWFTSIQANLGSAG